jgi:hypothetical protein
MPDIMDDAINARFGLTQGSMSYASYTHLFNDFLRRSRHPLTYDRECVRFIYGLAIFSFMLMLNPIVLSKRVTTCSKSSYIIFSMTS